MELPRKAWNNYVKQLSLINKTAADDIEKYIEQGIAKTPKDLVDYAYYVVRKYGNGSAALSAAMYDALAAIEGANVPPAAMADLPEYDEVAKSVYGTLKTSNNSKEIAGAASRLVKRTGADTMLLNAQRDGSQFAWIPSGDTCAFCIALASRGWQYMSKSAMKNGHAEHIHSNCDCTYAVRFDNTTAVPGYKPEVYREMYDNAEGSSSEQKLNSMRRMFYQENKDRINAQKREAYEKRQELNSSEAEETDVE